MNSTVNWPNHRFHRKGSNLLAAVLNLSNFILCPIAAVSRTRGGGLGLKKFQEALSIRPFLAVLPCALLVLPSLPSFRFLPVHFSSTLAACAIFQRSLLFPFLFFFSQIGRQLLGQLFLSLSFFRFLTTLARDLTDPIETTRPVAPRRMMNREIV